MENGIPRKCLIKNTIFSDVSFLIALYYMIPINLKLSHFLLRKTDKEHFLFEELQTCGKWNFKKMKLKKTIVKGLSPNCGEFNLAINFIMNIFRG